MHLFVATCIVFVDVCACMCVSEGVYACTCIDRYIVCTHAHWCISLYVYVYVCHVYTFHAGVVHAPEAGQAFAGGGQRAPRRRLRVRRARRARAVRRPVEVGEARAGGGGRAGWRRGGLQRARVARPGPGASLEAARRTRGAPLQRVLAGVDAEDDLGDLCRAQQGVHNVEARDTTRKNSIIEIAPAYTSIDNIPVGSGCTTIYRCYNSAPDSHSQMLIIVIVYGHNCQPCIQYNCISC